MCAVFPIVSTFFGTLLRSEDEPMPPSQGKDSISGHSFVPGEYLAVSAVLCLPVSPLNLCSSC